MRRARCAGRGERDRYRKLRDRLEGNYVSYENTLVTVMVRCWGGVETGSASKSDVMS